MNEDIEEFILNTDSHSFLESLARARKLLEGTDMVAKLDEVLTAEIELALMGAEKAKSEILKKDKDNKIRPIK